jgi:transcriptional regulator with XRE-family HTH domain
MDSPFSVAKLRVQFGRRLRQLRLARDFTQEQFAEAAGVSVDFLSLVERGVNTPSFETLERFAPALKIRVAELFSFGLQTSWVDQGLRHRNSPII